jgi:hypothetical protein
MGVLLFYLAQVEDLLLCFRQTALLGIALMLLDTAAAAGDGRVEAVGQVQFLEAVQGGRVQMGQLQLLQL